MKLARADWPVLTLPPARCLGLAVLPDLGLCGGLEAGDRELAGDGAPMDSCYDQQVEVAIGLVNGVDCSGSGRSS